MAFVFAQYFRWEVDCFRSPGPGFHTAILCLIPAYLAACAVYLRLRRRRWWRLEVPTMALLAAAALLFYQPAAALVCALLFLSCLAAGLRIASAAGVPLQPGGETIGLAFAFGAAAMTAALFLLGIAGLYYPVVFVALLCLPLAAFRREALDGVRTLAALFRKAARCPALRHPMAGIAFQFAFAGLACALAVTLTPSIAFDPLATHLPAARYLAEQHALAPLASEHYSYYPQGGEALMALAWALAGQPGAQTISPLFFALFLLMLLSIARTAGLDRVSAFAGVAATALMPFAHWTGSNAKNDTVMAFFEACALYALLRWAETRQPVWIPVGGSAAGGGLGRQAYRFFGGGSARRGCRSGRAGARTDRRTWLGPGARAIRCPPGKPDTAGCRSWSARRACGAASSRAIFGGSPGSGPRGACSTAAPATWHGRRPA
jgi:hypothetical protein